MKSLEGVEMRSGLAVKCSSNVEQEGQIVDPVMDERRFSTTTSYFVSVYGGFF